MIVDRLSYLISMLQVYAGEAFLLIALPMSMWRNFLKGKSLGDRFFFCVLTQTAFLVNLVLLLGLFKICSKWTVLLGIILEYCVVKWTYSDKKLFIHASENVRLVRSVIKRQTSFLSLRKRMFAFIRVKAHNGMLRALGKVLREHWLALAVVGAALVYNAMFLTNNVRIYHSYQFSDLPVHLSWVYGLEHGTLFVDGIYPFAMHAMIYVIRVIFQLELREIVLYFGSFQTLMFIVGLYLLSRRLFAWRFTGFFVLLFFSILLTQGRYAASLPQESGMFTVPAMANYLIHYLSVKRLPHRVEGDSKVRSFFRINQYLTRKSLNFDFFMLMLSVALVIAFHFYTAISAIVMAGIIMVMWGFRSFRKQYLVPIAAAAITGAMIAVIPFGLCFASGIPFQESMSWAMSVIQGEKWQGSDTDYLDTIGMGQETQESQPAEQEKELGLLQKGLPLPQLLSELYDMLHLYLYINIINEKLTIFVIPSILIGIAGGVLMLFTKRYRFQLSKYMTVIAYCLTIMLMGCASMLGVVAIFDTLRSTVFEQPYFFFLLAIPIDVVFTALSQWKNRTFQAALTAGCVALCGATGYTLVDQGFLHNTFDVNLAYYNEPDYLIQTIRGKYPSYQYTVVSPTDEYYAVVVDGFHTELSEFVAMVDGTITPFKIPTPYVFFFIEKYTLQDYFKGKDFLRPEYALEDFQYRKSNQDYYYQRNAMESKAYYWALKCMEMYPGHMQVYFEDEIYICFLLSQDSDYPLDLRIDYKGDLT